VTDYRDDVGRGMAAGGRFAALYACEGGREVRTVLLDPDGSPSLHSVTSTEGNVPTIVDLVPAAGWAEREAHDLYGTGFAGHHPLRPLVDHDQPLDAWTVPVHGRDVYQVAVGPVHAGVIESGHFRFHVVGDRILHLDAQLFYKYRGLEKAAEGVDLRSGMSFVARMCAACSVTNAVAYADACEAIVGIEAPFELRRIRTILVELERVWNHLNDIAAICAGVGMAVGNSAFASLTERARRLNAALTGHRFLRGAVSIGSSHLSWDTDTVGRASRELEGLRSDAVRYWRELAFNSSFQDRMPGMGAIGRDQARDLGIVGPAARASGLVEDARTHGARLAYEDFVPVGPEEPTGDVRARYEQRAVELWQSFAILDRLLRAPAAPVAAGSSTGPPGRGIGVVEGPRGRTVCVVESDGERINRLHVRTASLANWPAVAQAAVGDLLPDFPLINKSFELCYACADR
jgi:Ni,Fe-hydrogenase III large subunit